MSSEHEAMGECVCLPAAGERQSPSWPWLPCVCGYFPDLRNCVTWGCCFCCYNGDFRAASFVRSPSLSHYDGYSPCDTSPVFFLCSVCCRNDFRCSFSQNLLEIVAYQSRQKHLQALKEGKYSPLCRTEQAWRGEQQKVQDRLRAIDTVVHRVQQEHPQHQRALQWLRQCLGSRLSSQEA